MPRSAAMAVGLEGRLKQAWKERSQRTTGAAADSTTALLLPFVVILLAGMVSREHVRQLRVDLRTARALRSGYPVALSRGLSGHELASRLACLCRRNCCVPPMDRTRSVATRFPCPHRSPPSPGLRAVWLAIRFLGAVVFVPIAEELAFRAYLYRRLQSADFEHVSWAHVSLFALIASSALFGLCMAPAGPQESWRAWRMRLR